MNGFLKELGFAHMCAKDDFIPESIFYLLGMKASNDSARKFQMWLATEVIPSIRKHGAFIADSENVDEKYVLNELKFSQKRTIKTFANADVNEIKKLLLLFWQHLNYATTSDAIEKSNISSIVYVFSIVFPFWKSASR